MNRVMPAGEEKGGVLETVKQYRKLAGTLTITAALLTTTAVTGVVAGSLQATTGDVNNTTVFPSVNTSGQPSTDKLLTRLKLTTSTYSVTSKVTTRADHSTAVAHQMQPTTLPQYPCFISENIARPEMVGVAEDILIGLFNVVADVDACCLSCLNYPGCVAWTFHKAGDHIGGCWLKDDIPPAVENGCCDSDTLSYNYETHTNTLNDNATDKFATT
ncbi:uncharacterized protein LOC144359220 [Saccoglossus kowalevskii]